MNRRRFLAASGASTLLVAGGCLGRMQSSEPTGNSNGDSEHGSFPEAEQEITRDRETKAESDVSTSTLDGSSPNSYSSDGPPGIDLAVDSPITGFERLEDAPILTDIIPANRGYTAIVITSETGGKRAAAIVESDEFRSFIEETDFSQSIIFYANARGINGCRRLSSVDLRVVGETTHLAIEEWSHDTTTGGEQLECPQIETTLQELIRISFDKPVPNDSQVTARMGDAEIDIETTNILER